LEEATNGREERYVEHTNGMKLFLDMPITSYSFVGLYFQLRYEIPFWMYRKFYVEPVNAIEDIKRVMFMDLRKKRRQLRYEVKKGLKLTVDDNIESMVSRADQFGIFDAEDFESQVDRWLSQEDKVFSH